MSEDWILIDVIEHAEGGSTARFFRHRTEPLLLITVGGERIMLTKSIACDWQRAVGRIFAK